MTPSSGDPETPAMPLPGNVLVIGACGQLGLELTAALRQRYEPRCVVAADVRPPKDEHLLHDGPFELLDVLDRTRLDKLLRQYRPRQVYHLAAFGSTSATHLMLRSLIN